MILGPAVVVTPALAHRLEAMLAREESRAVVNGYTFTPEVVEFIRDVRRIAEVHRQVSTPADGNVSADTDVSDRPVTLGTMSPSDAAEMLGLTAHAVRDLVRRGVLPAEKSGGRVVLDPTDVQQALAQRAGR